MPLKINTRAILAKSFEELLETRDFEKITVNDIVDNCGASRSVFYKYFSDKYDLANYTYRRMIEETNQRMTTDNISIYDSILIALDFFKDHSNYFSKIIKYTGQNSFMEYYIQLFIKSTMDFVRNYISDELILQEAEFSATFLAAAHGYIITKWIREGFKESPETIARLLCENSSPLHDKINEYRQKK